MNNMYRILGEHLGASGEEIKRIAAKDSYKLFNYNTFKILTYE